jgi:hypothetical protein
VTTAPFSVSQARTGPMPTSGRWGWYKDHEGREYRRVSTLVKKVETDTYNLDEWHKRQVGEGLALRDDLVLALKAMGRPPAEGWTREQKKEINRICKAAAEAAKQRDGAKVGTAFHTLTERVDRGEPIEQVTAGLPAAAAETVRAYHFLRTQNGWRTVEVERTVVCDELEVAGTFDRVELIPGLAALLGAGTCQHDTDADHVHDVAAYEHGELPVTADVKTEEAPWLNGLHIGPQLGIYSRARRMWRPTGGTHVVMDRDGAEVHVPNGEYVPAPCVRQDVAVVVHLRDGKAEPYFVNLIEGWAAAQAAYEQMNREARAKRKLGAAGCWFAPLPNIVRPAPAQLLTQVAVQAAYADPGRPGPGQVGEVVTVGGIDFTRKVAADRVPPIMQPPAGPVVEERAVRGPDGLVRWEQKTSAEMMGLPGAEAAEVQTDDQAELRRHLIEAIWRAVTLDGLAILWNMARDRSVPWAGPVEMAADARRRQIECGQRALHTGTGKCACGWMPPIPA